MARHARAALVLVSACVAIPGSTVLAWTPVGDLRPVLLTGQNAPRGFTSSAYKVFPALVKNMPVAGKTCGTRSIRRRDWKQGVHQVFKRPWPRTEDVDSLEICGYLFTTSMLAFRTFRQTAATAQDAASRGVIRALRTPSLGDAVIAGVSPYEHGTGGYFLVFYYRNALVSLSYLYHRTPLVSSSSFVHMSGTMARKLEKSIDVPCCVVPTPLSQHLPPRRDGPRGSQIRLEP